MAHCQSDLGKFLYVSQFFCFSYIIALSSLSSGQLSAYEICLSWGFRRPDGVKISHIGAQGVHVFRWAASQRRESWQQHFKRGPRRGGFLILNIPICFKSAALCERRDLVGYMLTAGTYFSPNVEEIPLYFLLQRGVSLGEQLIKLERRRDGRSGVFKYVRGKLWLGSGCPDCGAAASEALIPKGPG